MNPLSFRVKCTDRFPFLLLGMVLLLPLYGARQADAQGFMVRPMTIEFNPRAGQTVERTIELSNTQDHLDTLVIVPVAVTESESGAVHPVLQADDNAAAEPPPTCSCLDWLQVDKQQVDIPPLGMSPVTVRLKIPGHTRGFYCAGLLVRSKDNTPKAMPGHVGVGVVVQFMVMIMVNVAGPQAKETIIPQHIGLHAAEKDAEHARQTLAVLQIKNGGETRSYIEGKATLMSQDGSHWRRVMEVAFKRNVLFPGITISLPAEIQRKLPAGHYRMIATVSIDGRRGKRLEEECDYAGDPGATTLHADAPVEVNLPEILVQAVPGGVRTAHVTLTNPATEAVQVNCRLRKPEGLKGVIMGTVTGDNFDCTAWGTLSSDTFLLAGGAHRILPLTFRLPDDAAALPNFYSELHIQATFPDGQSAGDTTALVHVCNGKQPSAEAKAMPISMSIALEEGTQFVVHAKFGNIGQVHFTPAVNARVASLTGQEFAGAPMETTATTILPLGTPEFSGVLEFAKVPAGAYLLQVVLTDGKKLHVENHLPIRVEEQEGKKVVTVIEEAPGDNKNTAESDNVTK